jgi:hypothetical protein
MQSMFNPVCNCKVPPLSVTELVKKFLCYIQVNAALQMFYVLQLCLLVPESVPELWEYFT